MKHLLRSMLAFVGLFIIQAAVQAAPIDVEIQNLAIIEDRLTTFKPRGQKGFEAPFEIQHRTGTGNGGLKELDNPSMTRMGTWTWSVLSDYVTIPSRLSKLSFIFSVNAADEGSGLGVYFGSDLLWSSPSTLFTEGSLYAADFDVSSYSGQSGWLSVQLLGQSVRSTAEYWIGSTLFDYAPAEMGIQVNLMTPPIAAIPEPSMLVLMGVGGLLLTLQVRQKMKRGCGPCLG